MADTIYYDQDGNPLENPDLADSYIEPRAGGGFTVVPITGEAKERRDKVRRLAFAERDLAATDYIAAKAMDALLGCETADEVVAALAGFKAEYSERIAARAELRATASALKDEGVGDIPDAEEVLAALGAKEETETEATE